MTSITPEGSKNYGYQVHLAANTPGHPNHEEAKARVAELARVRQKPVEIDSTNLERFDRDGIELVIDTCTGETFATQRGYVRMSGLSRRTIRKRCLQEINQGIIKSAKIRTNSGIQKVNLIPAKLVLKWAIKDNPKLAEAMYKAGTAVYFHQLAGLKISSITTNPSKITIDQDGIWCEVVERAKQLGYPVELFIKKRRSLERWVAVLITDNVKKTPLCNVYLVTEKLDRAIVSYFNKLKVSV